jgi:superfamily I DNA/RNA helicase
MTIHKSKGLEYDTIIFIGLEDNAFWNFRNQVDEETSNFFVALSRAKKRVIFTFTRNRNSRQNSQSGISDLYDVLRGSGIVNEYDFT